MTVVVLALAVALAAQSPKASELNEKAKQLAVQERYAEAEELWREALAAAPDYFPAVFNLGFMYHSRRQFEKAGPVLAKAAQLQPGDFNVRYLRGSALVNLGRREDGLREWRAALRIQPSNFKLMQVMAVEFGKGRYFQDAAELARRALDVRGEDANAWFIAIKACQDAGDPAAMELARRAVEKFPASARANFEYGYHLRKTGRTAESIPYLEKAMAADPDYEEPFFFYGESLMKDDRHEEAIGYLRTALRIRPDYVMASVALARALMELERYPEAVKELERSVTLSPSHPLPHLLLSQLSYRMGDEGRARTEKEISLRLRRADPGIMEVPQGRPFLPDASAARATR